jgi:PleD family two-component response regulator
MPLGDIFRRRARDGESCAACGGLVPNNANFCPNCGVRVDEPEAQPLHIVDRATGLFNERFIRPVLEDELHRAHRYGRPLGIVLVEPLINGTYRADPRADEETLKMMGAAIAGTLRDVDTPGVLGYRPPALLAVLPDTDVAGTAHAANRVLDAVNSALAPAGRRAALGIVCIQHGQRVRGGEVIEAAARSLKSGRPEFLGR